MNFRKRLSIVLIFILLISTADKVVYANPLEDQLQQYNQSIEEDTALLSSYEAQEEELKLSIQELDSKIESALYEKAAIEEEIIIINNLIYQSTLKIEQYTKEISEKEVKKNAFVRNMYKFGGDLSYVEVVFKSDNIFDAAYNFYNYSTLVSASKKNIEELDKLKKDLISEQETLELNKSELEKANNEVQAIVDEMTLMMDEQQEKLYELNIVQANLAYKIESEKAEVANITALLEEQRIQAELERQRQEEARRQAEEEARRQAEEEARRQEELAQSQQSQPNRGSNDNYDNTYYPVTNNYTAAEVVSYASQFQGVPYVWGGTSPSGFDCSGLVQYCYAQFGYYLPRVSQDQQNFGTDISLSQLRTGDLVFWGRPATHVAFYIDGGYILHAPYTGDVVRIKPINLNNITSAKRIIN